MNQWITTAFLVGLAALSASGQGQKRGTGSFPMERADTNGDGKASWDEVHEMMPRFTQDRFNQLDRNGDGLLSKDEVRRQSDRAEGNMPQGDRLKALLRRADADGDGRVTKQELEAVSPQLAANGFARLDTNEDGVITEADLKKQNNPGGLSPKAIRNADANGDGQWSYEELKTVAKRLPKPAFERVDANGDGLLNEEELQQLRKRRGGQQNQRRGNAQSVQVRRDAIGKILESDANGDGGVSFEELVAAKPGFPRNVFDRNDRNNDGVVSRADLPR